ncbi:MAG: site-2 protease family protein, partial [Acidimicrobiales bacterium]
MADRSGTVRLARIASVDIFVHWSWLIIATLLVLGFQGWLTTTDDDLDPSRAWLLAVAGAFVFFASILIHELAHAFMAKARGIEVAGITLFVFGGATEADASSRTAVDELVIAIVGPLTSLALAGTLGLIWAVLDSGQAAVRLIGYLAMVNLVLALFNLVPGLPLDGGRVLRAIVWGVTGDFARATRLATAAGVGVGYLLIGFGLVQVWNGALGGLWLAAIGWMISTSARRTEASERIREAFAGRTAADIMTSPVVTIPASLPVAAAVEQYLARHQITVFPVESETGTGLIGTLGVGSV